MNVCFGALCIKFKFTFCPFSAFFPSNWPVEIITESSNLLCQRSLLTYGTVLTDYTFEKTEGDFFQWICFQDLRFLVKFFFSNLLFTILFIKEQHQTSP